MLRLLATTAIFISVSVSSALACSLAMTDQTADFEALAGKPQVFAVNMRDPDSEEPIIRYALDFADGPLYVVEAKDCEMRNLRVTVLSPAKELDDKTLLRAGTILAATQIWQESFAEKNAAETLVKLVRSDRFRSQAGPSFSYGLDDDLSADSQTSSTSLTFSSNDIFESQFKAQLTLYFGVGGVD